MDIAFTNKTGADGFTSEVVNCANQSYTDPKSEEFTNNEDVDKLIPTESVTSNQQKSLDDVLSAIKFGCFHVRMMIVSCGCYFAVCSQMMLIVFLITPIQNEHKVTDHTFAWVFVISSIGGMTGGFLCGIISDKYGRKMPFLINLCILAFFGCLVPFSNSFYLLVVLRTFTCFGIGGLESLVYVLLLGE